MFFWGLFLKVVGGFDGLVIFKIGVDKRMVESDKTFDLID